jgi:hypothetical protein
MQKLSFRAKSVAFINCLLCTPIIKITAYLFSFYAYLARDYGNRVLNDYRMSKLSYKKLISIVLKYFK